MQQVFLFFLFSIILFSCFDNHKNEKVQLSDTLKRGSLQEDSLAKTLNQIFIDSTELSSEPNSKIKIHRTGQYHKDEVWKGLENKKWIGLFYGGKGYYLSNTMVNLSYYADEIYSDDRTHISGRELSVDNKDENILLINGINLKEGILDTCEITKNIILPNESISINFKGITYTLYATGTKVTDTKDTSFFYVKNYKLFIQKSQNNQTYLQLLTEFKENENSDDYMPNLLFMGDIDRDGKLDLILDTSHHYNLEEPTLYLSSEANKNEILKNVAYFSSTGC
jgi:hypothetical protein